ncbi:MAG TPA: hypothetical protein VGM92_06865, partial [Candidatus Kapabacteria bacterium]
WLRTSQKKSIPVHGHHRKVAKETIGLTSRWLRTSQNNALWRYSYCRNVLGLTKPKQQLILFTNGNFS